jgi:hypothetical protein
VHQDRLRSTFSSSKLVRLLGDAAPVEMDATGMDVAERLAAWVSAFDAIGLQAAHQAIATVAPAAQCRASSGKANAAALEQQLQRVRSVLAKAIAKQPDALDPAEPSYAPYRQRHAELQRQMELMIPPLRDHARQALSRASARMRQLAALDAALEQVLAAREQTVLCAAPALMQRRFEQQRIAHLETCDAGGWLQAFEQDWREALRGELDLRLSPVAGLVDALGNESNIEQ